MVVAYDAKTGRRSEHGARDSRIARRLAAVAGSAGAAITGEAVAAGITYVPTSGVVAAQGIPGFLFTPPTTVTSGTLRSPASAGINGWDIDGGGQADFNLSNGTTTSGGRFANLLPANPFSGNQNAFLVAAGTDPRLRNLIDGSAVGQAGIWGLLAQMQTYDGANEQPNFTVGSPGYVGFRFAFGNNANEFYYGWASLTIDLDAPGQGFKIGEAFYQSTPNTGINVGAVPVPEPSSMALLAAGAAGVTAWRARRKPRAACARATA